MNLVGDHTCTCEVGYRMAKINCSIVEYYGICRTDICVDINECDDKTDDYTDWLSGCVE